MALSNVALAVTEFRSGSDTLLATNTPGSERQDSFILSSLSS